MRSKLSLGGSGAGQEALGFCQKRRNDERRRGESKKVNGVPSLPTVVRGERFGAWRAEVYRTEPTDRSSPIRPIKPHR